MATPEQRKEKIESVKNILRELSNIEPGSLSRTEDLSRDINFTDSVSFFEEYFEIINQLNDRDISRLSSSQIDRIQSGCNQLSELIKRVREFNLNQNTPADVCKTIINDIKNSYDNIMDPLIIPLSFTATQATDYAKIEREAKGYHATMKEEHDKLMAYSQKIKEDANKALAAVQEQAAEAGVSTNAQIFLQNAKNHGSHANNWMKATVIISSVTLVVAILFIIISFVYRPVSTAETIQYVVSKIILLSTLSFGIFWCTRNYKAQKHNETLNQHRANALMTFRAFVEGTNDDRVKDAILLQASQAAFTPRPTGYDSPEKDIQTINPVIEIFGKSIGKS